VPVNPSGAEYAASYKHPFYHMRNGGQSPAIGEAPVRCNTGGPRYISLFRPDLENETWPLNNGTDNVCGR